MNSKIRMTVRIPFCFSDCSFCPHKSLNGKGPNTKQQYMAALIREIIAGAEDCTGQTVDSVLLTGGISAAVDGRDLDLLLRTIRATYHLADDCQIVINAYPGRVNIPTIRGCMKYHVTAIDCEVFTMDDRDRSASHLDGNADSMDLTQYVYLNTGFNGSAITLMYGMPKQTELSFRKSIARAVRCLPHYISLVPCGDADPVCDTGKDYRELARTYLTENGFAEYAEGRYSNNGIALKCYLPEEPGYDYIGFGLSAECFMDDIRCRNTDNLALYIAHSDDPSLIVQVFGNNC